MEELTKMQKPNIPRKEAECPVNQFRRFFQDKGLSQKFESVPGKVLNEYLSLFYGKLPWQCSEHLSPSVP